MLGNQEDSGVEPACPPPLRLLVGIESRRPGARGRKLTVCAAARMRPLSTAVANTSSDGIGVMGSGPVEAGLASFSPRLVCFDYLAGLQTNVLCPDQVISE